MNLVKNQMERTITTCRIDRGCEYLSEQFKEFCENKGIRRHLTIPGTLQRNGVVERRNWTLLVMVKSTMAQVNLLISLWGDAFRTVTYILNRVNQYPPLYTICGLVRNQIGVICSCYVHNATHKHGKFGHRKNKCIVY